MTLRRGFRLEPGEPVVVVEDVITTGGSTREVMDCVRAAGARVLAVGSLVDRGGAVDLGVPRAWLLGLEVPAYAGRDLSPLCRGLSAREARVAHRPAVTRFRLTLAYDGTDFEGWQSQARVRPVRTVQGVLEAALGRLVEGERVAVVAAGRTDAGVHALGQVVSFELPRDFAPDVLARALNGLLPADVRVLDTARAPIDFDARRWRRLQALSLRDGYGSGAGPVASSLRGPRARTPGRGADAGGGRSLPGPPRLRVRGVRRRATSRPRSAPSGGPSFESSGRGTLAPPWCTRSRPTASCARW